MRTFIKLIRYRLRLKNAVCAINLENLYLLTESYALKI